MTEAFTVDEPAAEVVPFTAGAGSGVGRMQKALRQDVSEHLTEAQLSEIGADVVQDWNLDKASNSEWRETAEKALSAAAQEKPEPKNYPFPGAANVRYPLLTISNNQFAARAYPAIVKGDEAIKVKTFGRDTNGDKAKRAKRVAAYLNWKLFYGVEGWEQDTDGMLHRLPAIGQHYRKVYYDPIERKPVIESISALRLTIHADAPNLKRAPRITHDFDRYPYEIAALVAGGHYRKLELLPDGEDAQASRLILEQHRMMDLDDDGLEEPYIVTVDHATAQVLRIDEAFDDDDIEYGEGEEGPEAPITSIKRRQMFVDYGFIPDPKGRAYSIGFGHLLTPVMEVINTIINLQIDAGHAQVAGGGFISAELRLQGSGQGGSLRWQPGEYKTVNATAVDLRNAIVERTLPAPSPVLFQLLGLLMEAAKDIASVNEAMTGDAGRNAPVGTTLALIEQGQQVFNAIYKRIYRGLREEFKLFSDVVARHCDPAEYARFCDEEPEPTVGPDGQPIPPELLGHNGGPAMDPTKLFAEDFASDDLDICPISDPSAVTKAQEISKTQFALSFLAVPGIYDDPRAVVRDALQVAGIEKALEWIPTKPAQRAPDPVQQVMTELEVRERKAKADKLSAEAQLSTAKAADLAHNNTGAQADAALALSSAHAQLAMAKAVKEASGLLPDPSAHPEGQV